PGDTVVFETLEASANQITPTSSSEALKNLSFAPIHPLTGPVFVEGAEPGDGLSVEIVSIKHKGWGWNGVIPGFGLLGDEFTTAYLHHYKLGRTHCEFRKDILIPYEPFCGVMGVGPREAGRLDTIPPRENGGNIDIRHLTPGTRVVFPVLVPGALFSCGDCHSAQGDGEVNGTGIESPMTVTLRFHLMKNAQQSIRYMIDHLVSEYNMNREQAYSLCGAAVDLKISEIVDGPNWIVSAYLPLSIYKQSKSALKPASKTRKAKSAPKRKAARPASKRISIKRRK